MFRWWLWWTYRILILLLEKLLNEESVVSMSHAFNLLILYSNVNIVIDSIFAHDCGKYRLPSLNAKFVRCSVRTCVHHVKQMLRIKLEIPACYELQLICSDRDLDDWVTLKQVWLMCWLTKVCNNPLLAHSKIISITM